MVPATGKHTPRTVTRRMAAATETEPEAAVVIAFVIMPKNLTMSDAVAAEGAIVNLTVSLKKPVTANAMAISYDYDATVLEPLRSDNQWIPKGVLQDFSEFGSHGVWSSEDTVDVSGDVCTLAFRVLPNAEYKRSTVRCSLTLQNADSEKKFTTSARITPACNHKYSPWVDTEQGEHSRICDLCDYVQTQPRTWDSGESKDNLVYTCTACGSQHSDQLITTHQNNSADGKNPWGSNIGGWGSFAEQTVTESTQTPSSGNQASISNQIPWGKNFNEDNWEGGNPSTSGQLGGSFDEKGTVASEQTTISSNNPWKDFYQQPNQETASHTEEPTQNQTPSWMEHLDTSIFQETTAPTDDSSEEIHDHDHAVPTTDPHEGHVHAQTAQKSNPLTVCALLGVAILFGVVAWLFLKKRKHH